MRTLTLLFWNAIYPVVVILALPFWLLKMWRRGGWGSGLLERLGRYNCKAEMEKRGGVYIHAVSVGEVLLALKFIKKWQMQTKEHFILVPTTATGMAVARENAGSEVRVIYAPLDFPFLIKRVMDRFEPRVVIMVESELWPNLIYQTYRKGISLGLMNARLSPRSGRRLGKFKLVVKPFLSLLDHVGVPEREDLVRWQEIGVRSKATVLTGNVKFDSQGVVPPQKRDEFGAMLAQFPERAIAMAVSTFAGEEEYLARVFESVGAQAVIVPRHAERREEVRAALDGKMVLRSRFEIPSGDEVFVIDTTGELRDWTAHADVVVIGKSFFEKGGQNPSEAILAGVPVICGPYMANFEPLVSELKAAGGIRMVENEEELKAALVELLEDSTKQTKAALEVISKHDGAMTKTIELFSENREV
ncbi:MAG TPA: hypothetical protein DDW68_09665 [Verrucomicrobiales bacterium]|nr:hypothetical protein [Verrucomicrobiales bacterium]HBE97424.1 hypothetical protein [Verrucomicrobiales bacterium]